MKKNSGAEICCNAVLVPMGNLRAVRHVQSEVNARACCATEFGLQLCEGVNRFSTWLQVLAPARYTATAAIGASVCSCQGVLPERFEFHHSRVPGMQSGQLHF